jgi:Arc/MetJ-type ribon-helix-helix transcriptional regulator
MPVLNFRVDEAKEEAIKARAGEVRYRSVSDYLRELVDADLKKAERDERKTWRGKPSD